jgi:YVTN family beta-propeller protein
MPLRLPTTVAAGALLAIGAVVLLSVAPAQAVTTVSGSGTGTILTQETALEHDLAPLDPGQPEDVAVAGADVYVANYTHDAVDVYSESTGTYVTSIGVGSGPEALAVSPDGSKIYVADSGSNDIDIIQTASNTASTGFSVGSQPISLAVSPDGTTIYVFFNASQQVSSYTVTGTHLHDSNVSGVGTGFHVKVSPDGTKVYVTYRDGVPSGDGGLVILPADLSSFTTISVPSASGLGLSPDGKDLFFGGTTTANVGHVAELDVATGSLTGNDAVVGQEPQTLVASPNGGWIYSASLGDGNVSVIDRSTFTSTAEGSTGATNMAISPDGLHLYVANSSGGDTDVFSIAQVTVSADAAITHGTASTPFTVSVIDGNTPVNDYSADTVVVNLYNASNTLVASSASVPMTVAGTVTLPIDTSTLPIGVYHATATLTDAVDTTSTSATATGFTVKATLAATGTDGSTPFILGSLLVGAGLVLFAFRAATTRRRSAS